MFFIYVRKNSAIDPCNNLTFILILTATGSCALARPVVLTTPLISKIHITTFSRGSIVPAHQLLGSRNLSSNLTSKSDIPTTSTIPYWTNSSFAITSLKLVFYVDCIRKESNDNFTPRALFRVLSGVSDSRIESWLQQRITSK